MLIRRIAGATRTFGAPSDWKVSEGACSVVTIKDVQTEQGNFMVSAWEPTPEELAAIVSGRSIELWVRGPTHPVVALAVAESQEESGAVARHSDDIAVDRFAAAMKEKLARARDKGRGGWEQCGPGELSNMLRDHVEKGDPRDVANFCMFLWSLGKPISDAARRAPGAEFSKWLEEAHRDGFQFTKWDMEDAYCAGEREARAAADKLAALLKECSATLKVWADVAPAVSLVKDIDAALAAKDKP